jgi:hypothetical protein
MTTLLFNLPVSVGSSVLSDWLTLKGITRLDRACCSHTLRTDYLAWTAGVTLTSEITIKNDSCSEWFASRGVQVRMIVAELFNSTYSLHRFERFTPFFKTCCSSLQSIQIFNNIDNPRDPVHPKLLWFISILKKYCSQITEIRMIGANFLNDALLAITQNRPNLIKLVVQYCRFMNTSAFANVWSTCKKLEVFMFVCAQRIHSC